MRGVCINLSDPSTLRQLLDTGAADRELGPCQTPDVNDGEWLTVDVCVAGDTVTLPARAREMGDGVRLDFVGQGLATADQLCTPLRV